MTRSANVLHASASTSISSNWTACNPAWTF